MDKGRKGQHGVGLAIKENILTKIGEDGIAIKCINARLDPNFDLIKFRYVRGRLRPDQGSAGRPEGQIHGSLELHRSTSARSGIRLRLSRREGQDKEER